MGARYKHIDINFKKVYFTNKVQSPILFVTIN